MATKTKSGGGTLFLAVALIVGAGFFYSLGSGKPGKEDRGVALLVRFEPEKRLTSVDVHVTVNGSVVFNHVKTKNSPWSEVVPLSKGQTVVLTATQEVPSRLSCAVYGVVQETRDIPGAVVCMYTRTS